MTAPDLSLAERARLKGAIVAHYDFVWRGLRRVGVSPDDARDAAQEVFAVLASKIASVAPGAEKAYLFQTVTHVSANYRRRQVRRSAEAGEIELGAHPDPSPTPEALADMNGRRRLLERLVAELSPELREVVILCELECMTLAEVAAMLGIPQGTVASRLRRARASLTASINNAGTDES